MPRGGQRGGARENKGREERERKGSNFSPFITFVSISSALSSSLSLSFAGGHFVPAVGHKIFMENQWNKGRAILINLKGLGIGNGLTGREREGRERQGGREGRDTGTTALYMTPTFTADHHSLSPSLSPSLPLSLPPILVPDPELQYQFFSRYARNNTYGIDLVSAEDAQKMEAGT